MNVKRPVVMLSIVLCGAGMAVGQTEWTLHPASPLLGAGETGSWEEGGRFLSSIVFDGSTYHIWYLGVLAGGAWSDAVGHATSSDGIEWMLDPANPVLVSGDDGEWDDTGILPAGAVLYDGDLFHMWYAGWTDDGVRRGGYATSPDGAAWTKHAANPIFEVGEAGSWDDSGVTPDVIMVDGDAYRMWYTGANADATYRVGYAESVDGLSWTKRPDPVLEPGSYPGAWDKSWVGNVWVLIDDSTYHMWFVGIDYDRNTERIGYAFSSDGIHWTKHRDNPVIYSDAELTYSPRVLMDGDTYRMWYSHWDGSTSWISLATSDCCPGVAGLNHARFIPAAAVASGAEGSFYQTDVDLNNADSRPVQYQLMWFPRGEDSSEPTTSETFTLGAGMGVRYSNVLAEVFGLEPDSFGALGVLASSPDLLLMSRTYNVPTAKVAGTYGQAIPGVSPADFIRSGERRRILFASDNADLRTNVGCQNGGDQGTVVYLELFANDGTSLETKMMILRPWGNDQINRVFSDHQPMTGYVDVWTALPDRSFYCYGSVLDNATSDPTTVPPQ